MMSLVQIMVIYRVVTWTLQIITYFTEAAQQAEKTKIKKLKQKKKAAGAGGASGDEGSDPDEGYEGDEDGGVLESDGEDDKMDLSAKPEKWEIG